MLTAGKHNKEYPPTKSATRSALFADENGPNATCGVLRQNNGWEVHREYAGGRGEPLRVLRCFTTNAGVCGRCRVCARSKWREQ
jgi:hypothetical protein